MVAEIQVPAGLAPGWLGDGEQLVGHQEECGAGVLRRGEASGENGHQQLAPLLCPRGASAHSPRAGSVALHLPNPLALWPCMGSCKVRRETKARCPAVLGTYLH